MKVEKNKMIDENIFRANIKLVDENKLLKHDIDRAINYIKDCKNSNLIISNIVFDDLLKILGGTVE